MYTLLATVLALFACSHEKRSYVDKDDDGTYAFEDCDDADPDVNPDAYERCNGTDDDCDGVVDDGLDTHVWFVDDDGDGYGTTDSQLESCFQPIGTSSTDGDCDDADEAVHPDGIENCDSVDSDCNGVVDDLDHDEDGFIAQLCGGDDCDDDDDRVNPDARERYYDGEDRNCDGLSDYDADQDGYDSQEQASGGDCDDTEETVNPGAEEVCNDDIDNNCDGGAAGCSLEGELDSTHADAVVLGATGDLAGWFFPSMPGDMDRDGYADLVIGAPGVGSAADDAGAAFVVRGPITGTSYLADAEARMDGVAADDQAGAGAALVGDTDDDTYPDLAVTAPGDDTSATDAGAAYLLAGPVSGQSSLADADGVLWGAKARDHLESVTTAGDISSDDQYDLLIAAPDNDGGGTSAGAVYLVLGPYTGASAIEDAAYLTIQGSSAADNFGTATAPAFDSDGDGIDDFVATAPRADAGGVLRGCVYLIAWPEPGVQDAETAAQLRFNGGADGDELGTSVASLGDFDSDGYPDLLMGAPGSDGAAANAGAAYVFPGGWYVGSEVAASAMVTLMGLNEGDEAGAAVGGPGDVNGDGFPDLLVSAPDHDGVGEGSGAVYLVYGPVLGTISLDTANATLVGDAAHDDLGAHGLGRAGDLNDDGVADIAIGVQLSDLAGMNAGAVLIFDGAGL